MTMSVTTSILQNRFFRVESIFTIGFIIFLIHSTSLRWTQFDNQYWAEFGHSGDYPPPLLGTTWVAILTIFLTFFSKRLSLVFRKIPLTLFFVIFFASISIIWSIHEVRSIRAVLALINLVLFCGLAINILGLTRTLHVIFLFGFNVLLISTLLAISSTEYAIMKGAHDGLWRGVFNHKNTFAAFSGSMLVLSISCRQMLMINNRIFGSSIVLCLVSLVMAGSATASVASAFAVILYFATLKFHNRPLIKFFIILLLTLVLLIFLNFLEDIAVFVTNFLGRDLTLSGRISLWEATVPFIIERPLTGYGFGTSGGQAVVDGMKNFANTNVARSVHNAYIDLALGFGLLATLAITSWFSLKMFGFISSNDRNKAALASGIAAYHIFIGLLEVSGGLQSSLHLIILFVIAHTTKTNK